MSSALTLLNSSLCSSSDTLSSFLSSVIKLSFSWRNMLIRNQLVSKIYMWKKNRLIQNSYGHFMWIITQVMASDWALNCSKNRTVCLLLKSMYLGFHIILHSTIWNSANSCSSITSHLSSSYTPILMRRRKIIISSCNHLVTIEWIAPYYKHIKR